MTRQATEAQLAYTEGFRQTEDGGWYYPGFEGWYATPREALRASGRTMRPKHLRDWSISRRPLSVEA